MNGCGIMFVNKISFNDSFAEGYLEPCQTCKERLANIVNSPAVFQSSENAFGFTRMVNISFKTISYEKVTLVTLLMRHLS